MIPNLFIVGAAKSGTTSVYSYLRMHPDIFLPELKEPHYFCTDFHRSSIALHGTGSKFPIASELQYIELFAGVTHESVVGEASASYLYSKDAAANIARFNPDAKIVICLRSPAEMLRSWHSYLLFCLEEDIESFAEAMQAEANRREIDQVKGKLPVNLRYPERLYYSSVAKLSEQVKRYIALFPRDQIYFVILDELHRDPKGVYSKLLAFLGLAAHDIRRFDVENARSVRKSRIITLLQRELIMPLVNSPKPEILSRVLPGPVRKLGYRTMEAIYNSFDRVNRADGAKYKDSAAENIVLKELHARLEPEVKQLALIVDRPDLIDLWGYSNSGR